MRPLLESLPPKLTICVLGGTDFVGAELITHIANDGHWIRRAVGLFSPDQWSLGADTIQQMMPSISVLRAAALDEVMATGGHVLLEAIYPDRIRGF